MPPAAGPARTEWVIERGLMSLREARRSYGSALRTVLAHLPHGLDLPPAYPLHELHAEEAAIDIGRRRVEAWFSLRKALDTLDKSMRQHDTMLYGEEWEA